MTNDLQAPRGTRDIFGDEAKRFQHVVKTAEAVFATYGFERIIIPTFEFTEVFTRPLGETSDIVSKEMYTFVDKGDHSITLRPEGTAGVCRAIVSNGLEQHLPLKFYYTGSMFRYERPQKGRYREHTQVGCELFGVDNPEADIEVIAMGYQFLSALGLKEFINLEINSLGDPDSRQKYREALVDYFSKYKNDLSEDSKNRLDKNPLRILDSKDEGDKKVVANAPVMANFLNDHSRKFFDVVLNGINKIGIPFKQNHHIVRGMDYYRHTTFEFVTTHLGSQGTVLGGGRYDGLVEQLGGSNIPGVGWGSGVDRLMMLLAELPAAKRPVAIIPLSDAAQEFSLKLAFDLRSQGIAVQQSYSGNMKKRMQQANKANAAYAIIIGDDELKSGQLAFKNLDSGDQESVTMDALFKRLQKA